MVSAAFLIGDTIKVKLKARWYDSTSLFFFFSLIEERSTRRSNKGKNQPETSSQGLIELSTISIGCT